MTETCTCDAYSSHLQTCPLRIGVRLPHFARAILLMSRVTFYETAKPRDDAGINTPRYTLAAPQYLWAVVCWEGMRNIDRMRWLRVRCSRHYTNPPDAYLAMEALALMHAGGRDLGRDHISGIAAGTLSQHYVCAVARRATSGRRGAFNTLVLGTGATPHAELKKLLAEAERECGWPHPAENHNWARGMMEAWYKRPLDLGL